VFLRSAGKLVVGLASPAPEEEVGAMFARVAVYEIPGGRMDEAVESFQGAIDEIAELHPEEVFVLVSRDANRALTMSLWERGDAMEGSRMKATRLRSEAAQSVGGSVQSVVEYEIAIRQKIGS
jgi:hypothetical protein